MALLHMHHAMANKAIMQAKYVEGLADDVPRLRKRLRELVLNGEVDYISRHECVEVTAGDRKAVLDYLEA